MIEVVLKGKSSKHKFIYSILAFAITAAILGWLVLSQREIIEKIDWNIRPEFLLLSLLAYLTALFIVALIWSSILNNINSGISTQKNILFFLLSNVGKRLPGTVWYIAWRIQLYSNEAYPVTLTSLASGVEFSIMMVSGLLVSVPLLFQMLVKDQVGYWLIGFMALVFFLLLNPKALSWIIRKIGKIESHISYKLILQWIVTYVFVWVLGGISLFSIMNMFFSVSIDHLLYTIACWTGVGVLSFILLFLPTNLGFNEIGIGLMLSQIVPSPIAVVIALASRILTTIYDILMAIIALVIQRHLYKKEGL